MSTHKLCNHERAIWCLPLKLQPSDRPFFEQVPSHYPGIILRQSKSLRVNSYGQVFKGFGYRSDLCFASYVRESRIQKWKALVKSFLPGIVVLKGTYVWMEEAFKMNYYHWHIDLLIHLVFWRSTGLYRRMPVLVATDAFNSWRKEILDYWDFDYEYLDEKQTYLVEEACTLLTQNRQRLLVKKAIHHFRKIHFSKVSNKNEDLRIYISRKLANKRRICNEEELLTILNRYGFQIIRNEQLSYEEQVQYFSRAQIIISSHGAGLVNQIYAPEGCHILEVFGGKWEDQPNCFYQLATVCRHNYYYFKADNIDVDLSAHWSNYKLHHNILLEIEETIKNIVNSYELKNLGENSH